MNDIDRRIETLKKEIALLERNKLDGFESALRDYADYDVDDPHVVLWDLQGRVLGILVDKEACKKFLSENV